MATFLVVHPVGSEMDPEESKPLAQAIKASLTPDAYWTKSCYPRESGKLFCYWNAKDADSIRQVLEKAAPELPTEGIYKIDLMFSSEDYR